MITRTTSARAAALSPLTCGLAHPGQQQDCSVPAGLPAPAEHQCWPPGDAAMTQQPSAISVKDCIRFIRERLDGAIAVAKAAEACAEAGDVGRALTIM